jgi:hypothetical protein
MTRRRNLHLEPLEWRSLLSGLSYSLTTDQSHYRPGQPIVMTFEETNASDQAISAQDGPSIDGFTVTHDGNVVWRSNAGINPLFIKAETLQPGQSLSLTATWDGIPTGGNAPVSGQFVISNQLNPQAAMASVTISASASPPPPSGPTAAGPAPISSPSRVNRPTASPAAPDPPTSTSVGMPVADPSTLALSVATNHPTYRAGHPVRMTVTLKNIGKKATSLTPGSSDVGFTVLEGDTPVWHSATTIAGSRKLRPAHALKLRASWSGSPGQAGVTIAPGTYTIEAVAGGLSGSATIRVIA